MTLAPTPDHDRDVTAIAAIARGDRDALAGLYDRHSSALMALGVRMLADRSEVEDVLHDVFVEVWKHAGDFDPERASVKTWIVLRMRSRCLDRLRAAPRARWQPIGERDEELGRNRTASAPGVADMDQQVDAGRLRTLLTELSEDQRAVIMLGFFDGLSSSEIANELEIPIGTVKSRVRSAMLKLRQALGVLQQ